jgi:hypothetical protein
MNRSSGPTGKLPTIERRMKNDRGLEVKKDRLRVAALLVPAVLGIAVSLVTAFSLVPRVRAVDVLLMFGSAFGAGAAFTAAVVALKGPAATTTKGRG